MAINFEDTGQNIEVIIQIDPAIHCTPEEYAEYLNDLDEGRLKLNGEEPTRFIMKKSMDFKSIQKIKKSQFSVELVDGQPGAMGFDMSALTELRSCLVDIKGPKGSLQFKKDRDDNLVSKELIALLDQCGAADELVLARRNAMSKVKGASKKN